MNHFQRILESAELAEAEYGNKSLGSFADYTDADFPGELRPSGKPDPEEKKRAERAYKSLRGRYRSDLSKVISSYLSKEKKYREAINAGLDVMDKAFVDAFIFGMRAQAAKKGVSAKFDLADQHYRWILSASEEEGRYFEDFLKDLRYKRDLRPGSMDWEQRVELYAKTLDSVFDAGRVAALALADNIVIYWVVNPEAESCNGCLLLEEKSPFTPDNLPCTPRDGATECLSNCRCNLLVKKVSAEEYAKVEFDQLPKDALLYQVNLFKQMKLGTNRTRKRR